jgi:ceramide glucosyltransferase
MSLPPFALLAVWIAWILQALVSALRVRAYVSLLGRGESVDDRAYRPKATVILPVKGIDPELTKCLSALLHQDYPDYRVVVVAESADDPACEIVTSAIDEAPADRATLLIAGHAPGNQGQKVHNQLAAIETLEPGADDDEVWAFIDSDVVPDRSWLANIVGPLRRKERNAVCTGYRWMLPRPAGGHVRPSVWAQLVSVMNASLAGLHGIPNWTLAWGGSMAMRVGTARKGDLVARWRGALTDDFPVTRMAEALGMRVHFVPRCMLVTPTGGNFTEVARFVRRQYVIVRVYSPLHFVLAFAVMWLYVIGFASAWGYLLHHLLAGDSDWQWLWPLPAILFVWLANQLRASARRRCIETAFGGDGRRQLTSALRWDRWATPLWMTLHALLITSALLGRTFTWRGIRYRLMGPNHVIRFDPPPEHP